MVICFCKTPKGSDSWRVPAGPGVFGIDGPEEFRRSFCGVDSELRGSDPTLSLRNNPITDDLEFSRPPSIKMRLENN